MLQNYKVMMAALICSLAAVGQGEDQTRVANAAGSSVVEAVVGLIQGSYIFPNDNQFLRRVAYVESKDGTDPNTYRNGYYGGIWQVDLIAFQDTQNTASHPALSAKYASISATFGITWSTVQWSDLTKPLYSGLAARLFLSNLATSIPVGVEAQANYWKQFYNTIQGSGTAAKFIQDILSLEGQESCTRPATLVFVLDQSGSIGSNNFQLVLDFCVNLTTLLDIETSHTQIGVLGFSDYASIIIPLKRYTTTAALVQAIRAIPYPAGGTNTAAALQLLPSAFDFSNSSLGIPKIAIVITDGQSNDPIATQHAAAALQSSYSSITMYAVGVGSGISDTELLTIANSDSSKVTYLSAFSTSQFQDLQSSINSYTCKTPARIPVNASVSTSVTNDTSTYYSININSQGLTLVLSAHEGALLLYASCQLSTPNEAFYEWKLSTDTTTNDYVSCSSTILYTSLSGYMATNSFVFSAVLGDVSTPQPPTGSPQSVKAVSTGSPGEILVQWAPLLEYQQNGIIDQYTIRLTNQGTGKNTDVVVTSSLFQYKISGLEPKRSYSVLISGHNADGNGPFSAAVTFVASSGRVAIVHNLAIMVAVLLYTLKP